MVFTVSQIYLSDAILGKDRALENLRNQINELSKILVIESKDKQAALKDLSEKELELDIEKNLSRDLQSQLKENESTISKQTEDITILGQQIESLLIELRLVAKALETYEGQEITKLETSGLGERINKALSTRIEQLNLLNEKLILSKPEVSNFVIS